ncbi:MAG: DNA-3-methyladenine glycosylase I [Thermomicrobiales bacterium]
MAGQGDVGGDPDLTRCGWAGTDPLYVTYHDTEWGVPCHDDRDLFERLVLEGFQAGLSWLTILRKRAAFRAAFEGFDPARVAAYGEAETERLLADAGIVRNRAKVRATIANAGAFLRVQDKFGTFDAYLWGFAGGAPLVRAAAPATLADVPVTSPESDTLSRDLRRRGFSFAGSTICYALMQSVGMVDDHVADCFRARPAAVTWTGDHVATADPSG